MILIASGADAQTVRPSFDCSKAGTQTENAICASETLAALDRALAETYSARRRALSGQARTAFTNDQRRWLGERNLCGGDMGCLEAAMRERLAILSGGGQVAAGAGMGSGAGPTLVLSPYSRANIGPVVLRPGVLELDGEVTLPIEEVRRGVYRLAQPVNGTLPNGLDFCSHMLVTFVTVHRHANGLYVLNAGGWESAPPSPSASDLKIPGACLMATYEAR